MAEDEERSNGYCFDCLVAFGYFEEDPREDCVKEHEALTSEDEMHRAIEDDPTFHSIWDD